MAIPDPWAFGINHLLTIIGFVITVSIAFGGFRSLSRWKREKIEEKRIDVSLEALALAYECEFVFQNIRSPISYSSEWADMKGIEGEKERSAAGPSWAILNRITLNKDYFDRLWKLQPRFMAVFGKNTSLIFMKLHQARRSVEVAAEMLIREVTQGQEYSDKDFSRKLRADIWDNGLDGDPIKEKLSEFVLGIEEYCLPIVEKERRKALN